MDRGVEVKVKTITIHDPDVNYGSTLQACATYNFIKGLGYDVEIINYRPNYKSLKQRFKKALTNALFMKEYKTRRKKIEGYFEAHAKLTDVYHNLEDLKSNPPVADVFITGSDVIWNRDVNSEGADVAFYLGFVTSGYKMSYAPSMGEIQSKENVSFIVSQINDFRFISVREEESKRQLAEAGLKDAVCVTDPVFLMPRSYYEEQIVENKHGEYILVYLMSFTDQKRQKVAELAGKLGGKVIGLGGFKQKCDCDTYIRDAGVEDFLSLIYHAKYIITDSFHCIAFSLMFEKQFAYFPSIDSNMRIDNILSYVDLQNRVVKADDSRFNVLNSIYYSDVTPKLQEKVEYSRDYFRVALSDINNELNR